MIVKMQTENDVNFFRGRTILVTGGTGSFGRALIDRVLPFDVREIRVFSRDEKKQDDLRKQYNDSRLKFYIGDVRNRDSVSDVIDGVDFVFHAAALKQVPSCEFYPMEALRTNVIGTENVLVAAEIARVKRVVVLSTDKAAYPINAMGITKALMEKVAIARSRISINKGCTICCTRYGNVMASRGSVIPLFIRQIQARLPLTVTEMEMTRFMMTLDQAVDLVFYAFQNAKPGDLFVQKAYSAKIATLIKALGDILGSESQIKVIGTRHGEKMYETLLTREERARAIEHEGYFCVPADNRDLNYKPYFSEGDSNAKIFSEYHSDNAERLDYEKMVELLKSLDVVKMALKGEWVAE